MSIVINKLNGSSGQIVWRSEDPSGNVRNPKVAKDGGQGDLDRTKDGKILINPGPNKAVYVQIDKGQSGKWGDADEFWRVESNAKGTFKRSARMQPLIVDSAQGLVQGGLVKLFGPKGGKTPIWTARDNGGRDWDRKTDNTKFTAMVPYGFDGAVEVNGKRFEVKDGKVATVATTPAGSAAPHRGGVSSVTFDGNDGGAQNIDSIFKTTRFEYRYTDPGTGKEVTKRFDAPRFSGKPGEGGRMTLGLPTGTTGTLTVISMGSRTAATDAQKPISESEVSEIAGRWSYAVSNVGKPGFAIAGRALEPDARGNYSMKFEPPLTQLQSQYLTDFKLRKSEFIAAGREMEKALAPPDKATQSVADALDNAENAVKKFAAATASLSAAHQALVKAAIDLKGEGVPLNWFLQEAKDLDKQVKSMQLNLPVKVHEYALAYDERLKKAKRIEERDRVNNIISIVGSVVGGLTSLGDLGLAVKKTLNDAMVYKGRKFWFGQAETKDQGAADAARDLLARNPRNPRQTANLAEYERIRAAPEGTFAGNSPAARESERQRQMGVIANRDGDRDFLEMYSLDTKAAIARNKMRENDLKLQNVSLEWGSIGLSIVPIGTDAASMKAYVDRIRAQTGLSGKEKATLVRRWEVAASSLESLLGTMRSVVPWERISDYDDEKTERDVKDNQAGPAVEGYATTRWRVRVGPYDEYEGGRIYDVWLEGSKF